MIDLIKKILKEETSGLTDAHIKSGYKLMNFLTKGYYWYYDTPKQPFKDAEGTIWLINPKTKRWMLELEKSGDVWFYYELRNSFSKYINLETSYFKLFIKIWIEDTLKREVLSAIASHQLKYSSVEDALENGKQIK
jgi:hypothetical protein